jgi:altronate dehydratase large subunit
MQFMGYKRTDGKCGVRNKVLILPTCSCSSETARMISMAVDGTTTFTNQNGCAQPGPDFKPTLDVMVGFAANPNIYGTVVVGLGCETAVPSMVVDTIRAATDKPVELVVIQEDGGTLGAIDKGCRYAREMVGEASGMAREPLDVSELIVGTECGGSDSTSGLAANPVVGAMSDLLVEHGATSILSETTEFIGAEHILARRALNKHVHDRLYEIIKNYEDHLHKAGTSLRGGNPSPGNKAGGLTTIEEKSLGCIHKGGESVIQEVVDYAQAPTKKGLVIMDTPGYDVASLTGMAAGGAVISVFTTGRGTPTGNPIMPVIKLTGNAETFQKMICNIDFDASGILTGSGSIEQLGRDLFDEVIRVANGKMPKAEALRINDIAIIRVCNYV